MKKTLICAALGVVGLSGCAFNRDSGSAAASGSAVYRLQSPDCEVEVVSGRTFGGGALVVGEDCSLEATIEAVDGAQTLDLIQRLLDAAP